MNVSYNWLKQYVKHGLSTKALADTLTMAGLEIEAIDHVGPSLDGVVVGHVLEVDDHPNADRLTLCQVDLGDGVPVQIACGAPNVAAGQKVPVATVGTTLLLPSRKDPLVKEEVEIKKAKLRGETSEGMICAEDELGLSDDHSGIMVLREEAETGQAFAEYLEAQGTEAEDAVLDVAITPNRPDATSHIGVARDVAAVTKQDLRTPEVTLPAEGGPAADAVSVTIHAPDACTRYVGMVVRGVEIGESPVWLKRRLEAVGLRPRNNVVDVTNFVMHEFGQPLHAFDLDRLAGPGIHVRLTDGEESFVTLDDEERTLPEGTLLICDDERPVAIAGVMGGQNSEVTDATTDILIESAYFDPATIRRTSKALQLQTDSSYRFERGVNAEGQVWAAARAAELIAELAGGEIVPGMVDAHPRPHERRTVDLRLPRIERILGTEVPPPEVRRLLEAIGFTLQETSNDTLRVAVPPYRPDVEGEIDLIEEVARLYGYDRIPSPPRTSVPGQTPEELPSDRLRRQVRGMLTGMGFREIYTNSLLREELAEQFNVAALSDGGEPGPIAKTLNPISQEMAALRPSLLPGMLQVMGHNQSHGQRVLRFAEWGHVFRRTDRGDATVPGYAEHESFLLALSGPHARTGWDVRERPSDFFDLKGGVESLLETLRIPDVRMETADGEPPVATRYLQVTSGAAVLGTIAQVDPDTAAAFDLDDDVFFAELDWHTLVTLAAPELHRGYRRASRFPVVDRDLAVVVHRGQPAGAMLDTIRRAGAPLLRSANVFDVYEGEHVGNDEKSIAFALRFGAERTLRDEDVDAAVQNVLKALEKEHDAELRQ